MLMYGSQQLHAVYKKLYFSLQVTRESVSYYKSRENSYQVLQVMWAASEHAVGLYDKNHCTKLYQKKHHSFVAIVIATRAAHS